MKTLILASLVAATCLVASCSKTGPAGAAGATGPTGATGPDSVQYSPWITIHMISSFDMNNYPIYIDTIAAPSVTAKVINQGAVLGYIYSPTYLAEGDSSVINVDNEYAFYLLQTPQVGKIILSSYDNDFSGFQYRYVIVPGNVSVSSSGSSQSVNYTPIQLRNMNYSTLTGKLGIPATGSSLKAGSN